MARGWESKSVESQMEDRSYGRAIQQDDRDPEAIERERKRESLELSRRRVTNELQSARSEVHRAALENALRHLEDELRKFG